jgi:hypothetical protein
VTPRFSSGWSVGPPLVEGMKRWRPNSAKRFPLRATMRLRGGAAFFRSLVIALKAFLTLVDLFAAFTYVNFVLVQPPLASVR